MSHTDPAYVIHLKYKYLPEYQLQRSKWAAFVIDRPNLAVWGDRQLHHKIGSSHTLNRAPNQVDRARDHVTL